MAANQEEESKGHVTSTNSVKPSGQMHSKRASKPLNNGDDSGEDENFEEPNKTFPKFLMGLPGITATDSLGYKIEALRVYLENQLGDIPFIAAYKHLINLSNDDEQTNDELEGILGAKKMKFVTLIHHLIVCEDSYYGNN